MTGAEPNIFNFPPHLQRTTVHWKPVQIRSTTVQPSRSSAGSATQVPGSNCTYTQDHSYCMQSPTKMKRKLSGALGALEMASKKLKIAQQCRRRLYNRVSNMTNLLSDLRNKQLLSDQAASNLSASFGESALAVVARCINQKRQQTCECGVSCRAEKFCTIVAFLLCKSL